MINPSKIGNCVSRALSQQSVLYSLFAEAKLEDIIFSDLNNLFTKAYLQFLNVILALFNSFNMLFQSEKLLISSLVVECERFLRLLGRDSSTRDISHDIETFTKRCLQFYQIAYDESVKRLPSQKGLIRSLIFLEPCNALGKNQYIVRSNTNLTDTFQKFNSKVDLEKAKK